ncbi:AarF/ABC1/UbiB kinase family protein [Chloroflexia bacterium SDU3-3]|nr:AarF/ABC1/UbiB kinase family protein [Chloroflexia bacterium SDU3-3]
MWPIVRQARNFGRYRQIAQVLTRYGFGFFLEQVGLAPLLALPRRVARRPLHPVLSGPERLRLALIELGPTFVKLGQAMSTRPDLIPPEYVVALSKLQDAVTPFGSDLAIAMIEADLGKPIGQLFRQFDEVPIAAASLGQVHTAVLHDGSHVVIKIQRPGIDTVVNHDLAILQDLATLAKQHSGLGNQYDFEELAWEFAATLRAELDYRREGRNAERFAKNFVKNPHARVPQIYWEYSSTRILTMERIFGIKINDLARIEAEGLDRKQLAQHACSLILQEIFADGFFHADPHPGNMFAMPGEVICAIDFGQVVVLDRDMTNSLLLLLHAITQHDVAGMLRAMQRLDILSPAGVSASLQRDAGRFLDRFIDQPLEALSARETINELFALVQRHQLRMPAQLAILLKALVMMEGTGVLLDPQLDVFAIARPYTAQALRSLLSPERLASDAWQQARDMGEMAMAMPQQMSSLLRQLNEGELTLKASIHEAHQIANALTQASIRLALAVVLGSFVLGIGLLGVAIALGLGGTLMMVLGSLAGVAVIMVGLALIISFLRRGLN